MAGYTANRQIRAMGISGEQLFHGEEIGPDDWRAVDFERSRGICRYSRETLITRLADLIGAGHIWELIAEAPGVHIDRTGNIWLDHDYLAPNEYLPRLIP